jgi:histidinol-phosphatase (PHP family)
MRYVNLHNHSTFSDGDHTPEEIVLAAIEKNMLGIGFSDHSYTDFDPSYCMLPERYPEYFRTIDGLKEKYGGQIRVYKGLEQDYYSDADPKDYDYRIASVHYIIEDGVWHPIDHTAHQQQKCIDEAFCGDVMAMAARYYEMLCEHVERCKPTLVGHFDVISKFGLLPEDSEEYRELARTALKRILRTCPYVEMNTGGIARGFRTMPYPCDYLLDTLRGNGGEVMLGADSHHRDNLIFGFDEAVQRLKRFGFDHIVQFTGTGFERFVI